MIDEAVPVVRVLRRAGAQGPIFRASHTVEAAPVQLVPVPHPDRAEIAGDVVDIGNGRYARLQLVVYTGVYLNQISRIDILQSTFTADFYLRIRFSANAVAGAADPFRIQFPDMVGGDRPVVRLIESTEVGRLFKRSVILRMRSLSEGAGS